MKLFLIIGKFFWKLFYSSKRFRRILFDSHSTDNKFLLSVQNENYVVSTRDKVIGRDIYVNGQFDFEKLEKALKLLGNKFSAKVLIDIGANIGTICIPSIKRKIFSTAIAFEPDPTNFTLLNANILLNHINDSIDTFNYPNDLNKFDCIVLSVDHDEFKENKKIKKYLKNCKFILDNNGVWENIDFRDLRIEYHISGDSNWLDNE